MMAVYVVMGIETCIQATGGYGLSMGQEAASIRDAGKPFIGMGDKIRKLKDDDDDSLTLCDFTPERDLLIKWFETCYKVRENGAKEWTTYSHLFYRNMETMTKFFQENASGRLEVCDWGTNEADVALASRHCIQLQGLTMTMLQNCLFLMCEQVCQACTETKKLEATIEALQTGAVSAGRIEHSLQYSMWICWFALHIARGQQQHGRRVNKCRV